MSASGLAPVPIPIASPAIGSRFPGDAPVAGAVTQEAGQVPTDALATAAFGEAVASERAAGRHGVVAAVCLIWRASYPAASSWGR